MSIVHIAFRAAMSVPSAGVIAHIRPLSVMAQLMWHIMGIIAAPGIDIVAGMGICIAAFIIVGLSTI